MNRRDFVRLMGMASGASLLSSCNLERQTEKIIPYLVPPDDGVIPGVPVYSNTTCTECPAGCGVSTKVVDYRAAKLEGTQGHPINDGALCMRGQASIGRIYHPERIKGPLSRNGDGSFSEVTWDSAMASVIRGLRTLPGAHAYLGGHTTGSLSVLIDRFCEELNVERLPEFELYSQAAIRKANEVLFGRREIPAYHIEKADYLLTIGADVFETFVSPVSHNVQFARAKRRSRFDWVHLEPHMSLSGAQARRRHVITPGSEPYLLAFLLRRISQANLGGDRHISGMIESLPNLSAQAFAEKTGLDGDALESIASGILSANNPLLIAGGVSTMQSAGFQTALLAGLCQWASGMTDSTVDFGSAANYEHVGDFNDLKALSDRLAAGEIGVLFLSRTDPVGAMPGGADLSNARLRVGLGEFLTDTLKQCDIVLPLSNVLESWGDATPRRGLLSVVQPAVEPIYDTRNEGDVLLQLLALYTESPSAISYQEFLFDRWTEELGEKNVDKLLRDGYVRLATHVQDVSFDREAVTNAIRAVVVEEPEAGPVLVVAPSIRSFDGRGRNLHLLSELPDPLTTITYGEWASVSMETAHDMGLTDRDEIELSAASWSAQVPIKIQPGLARGVIVMTRGPEGRVPVAVEDRSGELVAIFRGVKLGATGGKVAIPILAGSQSQEGRGVIPSDGNGHDRHGGHGDPHGEHATLYPDNEYRDYRWGMAIDLDLCTGCSACASACYVENNVPIVGPEDHLKGREMSWIRIESFYDDETHEPEFQPMLCQHCTNAPCESVCPVFATFHNEEGLNAQVYNRCVGTRYCANNCPYKVRRFNWFDYERPSLLNTTRNPEVSVRGRGVMEKCSFCVQRIRSARDKAKDEERKIADGEVTPACAQTCPSKAIVFGNLLDDQSEVRRWAESDRAYRVFDSLGTGPAVHYLKSKWKNEHA